MSLSHQKSQLGMEVVQAFVEATVNCYISVRHLTNQMNHACSWSCTIMIKSYERRHQHHHMPLIRANQHQIERKTINYHQKNTGQVLTVGNRKRQRGTRLCVLCRKMNRDSIVQCYCRIVLTHYQENLDVRHAITAMMIMM